MAKKTVYQDFDQDALDHFFGTDEELSFMGVPLSGGYEFGKVLVSESEATYDKINNILTAAPTKNFSSCKKAFVYPKSPVSLDRIKAACKEHKITITNDYTLADMVIVHDDNTGHTLNNGERILNSHMSFKLWNYESVNEFNNFNNYSFINQANKWILDNGSAIWDEKLEEFGRRHDNTAGDSCYDVWCLTGMAINLAYKIDTGLITPITMDDLLLSSATRTPFTEELGDLIYSQCNNYNNEDIELAGKLIPTIDPTGVPHLFWEFISKMDNLMHKFNRNKDVQYWLENVNWDNLSYKSAEDMIGYLEEKGQLTHESFCHLEPLVRKEISICNRELYVFKVSVKPEYRKYLKKTIKNET